MSTQRTDRTGFTTGACAAAAAKAATMLLVGQPRPTQVDIALPDGTRVHLPVHRAHADTDGVEAAVRKDAGDDPDVTNGCEVVARVAWRQGREVCLRAGVGVGTITKPGLSVLPGEPAINPAPRKMIHAAIREVTDCGLDVTLSIPNGAELAIKTFNPRLGVVGGLSILGTTGRVRPFSTPALREALRCSVTVAKACGVRAPVLVPGHIGERAARAHFHLSTEQVIEVGNEWGYLLDEVGASEFERVLVVGHAGKLAKLPEGAWDTHSSRSASAVPGVLALMLSLLELSDPTPGELVGIPTVEGLLNALPLEQRTVVADALAARIVCAVEHRIRRPAAVVLVNLQGTQVGQAGELAPWSPSVRSNTSCP